MIHCKGENPTANSLIYNTSGENEPIPQQYSKSSNSAMPKLPKCGFMLNCMRCKVDKLNGITLFHH
jgi:hypothetical protein